MPRCQPLWVCSLLLHCARLTPLPLSLCPPPLLPPHPTPAQAMKINAKMGGVNVKLLDNPSNVSAGTVCVTTRLCLPPPVLQSEPHASCLSTPPAVGHKRCLLAHQRQ